MFNWISTIYSFLYLHFLFTYSYGAHFFIDDYFVYLSKYMLLVVLWVWFKIWTFRHLRWLILFYSSICCQIVQLLPFNSVVVFNLVVIYLDLFNSFCMICRCFLVPYSKLSMLLTFLLQILKINNKYLYMIKHMDS